MKLYVTLALFYIVALARLAAASSVDERMTEEEWEELKEKVEQLAKKECLPLSKGKWVAASNGVIPKGAVLSGWDPNRPYWVGRATVPGNVLPCKLTHVHKTCWLPWNNTEYSMTNYEVLVDADTKWVATTSKDKIPNNAVAAGKRSHTSGKEEVVFVGRAYLDGMLVPGYVGAYSRQLLHSTKWQNALKTSYEILVYL